MEGALPQYAKCFQDMIDRGVVTDIYPQELKSLSGPLNWNTHNDIGRNYGYTR